MSATAHGVNAIEVNGAAMLLTTTGGGVAVHLTAAVENPGIGREAVPDFYFTGEMRTDDDALTGYDRAALTAPRWSPTTLCGRGWVAMAGGDGGAVGRFGKVAFAPTCRRCLALIDRHFPKPTPDSRLIIVARLVADAVVNQCGYAEIHDVPGDQQAELRRAVRAMIRKRTTHAVRTYVVDGTIHVECRVIHDEWAGGGGHEAAESIGAALAGQPMPETDRDWVIDWTAWEVR